jgi:hypothetical protein
VRVARTRPYVRSLKRMGVSDAEAQTLEAAIASDPTLGDVVPGMRGIRKVRFGFGGRGKRGGGRAVYVAMLADEVVVMLLAYAKNDQTDLTSEQRRMLLGVVEQLQNG